MAQMVRARPSVREVPSSIPLDTTSLFQLLSFLCLTSFKYPYNGALMERGGKMSATSTSSLSVITVTSYRRKNKRVLPGCAFSTMTSFYYNCQNPQFAILLRKLGLLLSKPQRK